MKKKSATFKLGAFKYLLFVPLLLLSFCQSEMEEPYLDSGSKLTPDAKVLLLMKSAIFSDLDKNPTQNKTSLLKAAETTGDDQCTHFLYPITFEVYSGDNPNPVLWEINSDEEMISFVDTLVASAETYEFYIYFPITLLDSEGGETVLNDLTELEGTLQMAVEACENLNNDTSGGDDGSNDGSNDGANDGSNDGSGDGSDDGSDDSSDDASDDGSDSGSDDGSGDGSEDDSDDGSDSSSDDDSGDGSGDGSDGEPETLTPEIQPDTGDNGNGYEYCDKNSKKVKICHKGINICVSVNAIWGHMQHHEEDYLGGCDE